MKKRMFLISVMFILLVSIVYVVNKKDKVIILGDYILNPLGGNKIEYDSYFSYNELTSSMLLEYLDSNAYDIKNKIKINKYIKSIDKMYLSVGMNDLLEYVSLDDKLVFNYSLLNEKLALLEYNVHEIISSILALKDIEIIYISLYCFGDYEFDEIIKEYNEEMKVLLNGLKVEMLDINEIIKIENYTYTSKNQLDLYGYILEH